MLWMQQNRESIKRKYPECTSVADVAKKAGELWKTLSADDKVVSRYYRQTDTHTHTHTHTS